MPMIFRAVVVSALMAVIAGGWGCSAVLRQSETEVTVNPSKFHEDCIELSAGDVMIYSFKALRPVDFNIHFHMEETCTYPVSEKNVSSGEGKFYPERRQFYCLMWTNPQKETVRLSYTYRVGKK